MKTLTEIRHNKVLAINLAEAEVLRWNNELEDDFSIYSRSYSALRVHKAEDNLREAKADLLRFDKDFKERFAELDSRSKSEEREEISSSSDLEIGFDFERSGVRIQRRRDLHRFRHRQLHRHQCQNPVGL